MFAHIPKDKKDNAIVDIIFFVLYNGLCNKRLSKMKYDGMISECIVNKAREYSTYSDFNNYKMCAILFKGNTIYAIGVNSNKGNPMQCRYDRYRLTKGINGACHAEISAIRCFLRCHRFNGKTLSGLSIFIFRQHKDGSFAMAKPCPACERALREFGIRDVYYTGNCSIVHERYDELF